MDRTNDISEFLTSRRARVTPEQAGLPSYGKRRVPGLRREEVASLAGVSVEYYKRLERGNLSGVSDMVLEALARALQLDDAERAHLFDLARVAGPTAPRPRRPVQQCVRPVVQRILDQMRAPVIVRNARCDYVASNQLGRALYAPLFESREQPANSARFTFLDPAAVDFYPEWEQVASDLVAHLRSEAGRNAYDRGLSDLVGELSTRSNEFRTRWAAHNVRFHRTGTKRLHHPGRRRPGAELRVDGDLGRQRTHDDRLHGRGRQRVAAGAGPPRKLDGHHGRGRASPPSRRGEPRLITHECRRISTKRHVLKERYMEHRLLGRTGVSVSKLCLGTMMFGAWGNPDHDDSIRIIHAALDAGINFVDTADVYSAGESEEIVGKALAGGRRDDVVLATKISGPMGEDPNRRGTSRRWIIQEVENSLRRLGTDWIDLYQIHRYEPDTDIEETLGALTDLVHQGKVRYIGSSTFPASAIVEAQWAARDQHLQRYVTEQPPYSILARGIESDVLPTCQRYGMGVIPWSPLAGGWLSGRYRKNVDAPHRRLRAPAARRPLRPLAARQPAQARRRRPARAARRRGRHPTHPARDRIRREPPGGDGADHRTAHHGAPREPAPRGRHRPRQALLDRIDEIVPPGTTSTRPTPAGPTPR